MKSENNWRKDFCRVKKDKTTATTNFNLNIVFKSREVVLRVIRDLKETDDKDFHIATQLLLDGLIKNFK